MFGWRISRLDPSEPDRLVGELRLTQWAALLLAITAGASVGCAIAGEQVPSGTIEVTLGVGFAFLAALILTREPRDGLLLAAAAFVAHALVDIAHRPGLLSPDLMPRWFAVGDAILNVFVGAVCYWVRRR
jgi:hypothetical protein